MKIEDQCVSLELARKLKELGVNQESYFYWQHPDSWDKADVRFAPTRLDEDSDDYSYSWAAYTVTDLGRMLPYKISNSREDFYLSISKDKISWLIAYKGNPNTLCFSSDINESNAYARMLIFLLENKLVTVDDVNNALEKTG